MSDHETVAERAWVVAIDQLDSLFTVLGARGYRLIGPTERDGAIVLNDIVGVNDLPIGLHDQQEASTYQLLGANGGELFGYAVGPTAWKRFLFPADSRLFRATQDCDEIHTESPGDHEAPMAFIGVRSCDLHAIATLDRVMIHGAYVDPAYAQRRQRLFILAVNCTKPAGTCFCSSMGAGPTVTGSYDLLATEVTLERQHRVLLQSGSEIGDQMLALLEREPATPEQLSVMERAMQKAEAHMGRRIDTCELKEILYRSYENPYWEEVASRCATCGNCTMVCPTCFCSTVEDTTDLSGLCAERWRRWDSCFTLDFSYIAGGSLRYSAAARYRQWLMHKLATYADQFDRAGCVGCGRCITWCPVGIDITSVVEVIRQSVAMPVRSEITTHA